MFRKLWFACASKPRFPRIRGDVPGTLRKWTTIMWFSPHTRGCSDGEAVAYITTMVFPAYAGMFLWPTPHHHGLTSFPRIRGDVPMFSMVARLIGKFSPHTRGCSAVNMLFHVVMHVFPAYAGMFLKIISERENLPRFPRIRGDVPAELDKQDVMDEFSPHTRGCSSYQRDVTVGFGVFPAYAGMFR